MKRLFYLFMLIISPAFSSQFPVVTSINVAYNYNGATYYITQGVMEIGKAADTILPSGMTVSLFHKHTDSGSTFYAASSDAPKIYSDGVQTVGELALKSYNSGGKNINTITHIGPNGFKECVAYAAEKTPSMTGVPWSEVMLPAGCLTVPPADEWCKITSPEIILEHGTITLQQAEGDIASTSVGVQCTSPTAVTFSLISSDKYVYLDEGKSEVTIDNKALNSKLDLPQGDSQMPVKDILTGVTKEGFHTGSSVLVMMPY